MKIGFLKGFRGLIVALIVLALGAFAAQAADQGTPRGVPEYLGSLFDLMWVPDPDEDSNAMLACLRTEGKKAAHAIWKKVGQDPASKPFTRCVSQIDRNRHVIEQWTYIVRNLVKPDPRFQRARAAYRAGELDEVGFEKEFQAVAKRIPPVDAFMKEVSWGPECQGYNKRVGLVAKAPGWRIDPKSMKIHSTFQSVALDDQLAPVDRCPGHSFVQDRFVVESELHVNIPVDSGAPSSSWESAPCLNRMPKPMTADFERAMAEIQAKCTKSVAPGGKKSLTAKKQKTVTEPNTGSKRRTEERSGVHLAD